MIALLCVSGSPIVFNCGVCSAVFAPSVILFVLMAAPATARGPVAVTAQCLMLKVGYSAFTPKALILYYKVFTK